MGGKITCSFWKLVQSLSFNLSVRDLNGAVTNLKLNFTTSNIVSRTSGRKHTMVNSVPTTEYGICIELTFKIIMKDSIGQFLNLKGDDMEMCVA